MTQQTSLARTFLRLPVSRQRKIIDDLGLLTAEEQKTIPRAEQNVRAFRAAAEKGVVDDLRDRIQQEASTK